MIRVTESQETEKEIREKISDLLKGQILAVLASQRHGQPYSSLIAFAHSDDLRRIYFATPKATRKFANLIEEPRVSLLVDSRSNNEVDFHKAEAVTIMGVVKEVGEEDLEASRSLYLARHPYLGEFIHSPSTAFLEVEVRSYILVNRFQHVMELHLTDDHDIFA